MNEFDTGTAVLPRFNLIDQPWLLARDRHGETSELSLVDVLRRSGQLAGLVGDVPTQVFALTRVLLAVLHGALRPSTAEDWEALWEAGPLPMDTIETYLDRNRDRFELFHERTPFMQVADLRTAKGEWSDLSKLVADVPNGRPFFTTRLAKDMSLSYAEAARWLVHCQAFDPSGIKSGAVGDDRVKGGRGYPIGVSWCGQLGGLLPEGRTLRDTLLLNLVPRQISNHTSADDVPIWERPPLGPAEQDPAFRKPAGPVALFTWQSRRIRLKPQNGAVTSVLICNGDKLAPQNMHTTETHSAWRYSEPQSKKFKTTVYMPLKHDEERMIWRGLTSMLPDYARGQGTEAARRLTATVTEWLGYLATEEILDRTYPIRVRTLGITYGSNESVIDEVVDDALSIQAVLAARDAEELKGAAESCVEASENAAKALSFLAADLTVAAGGDPAGPRARAAEAAYAALDPLFREWLSALGPDSDPTERQISWHRTARETVGQLGQDLVRAASPASWVGRVHNKRLYTTAHADARFRIALRKALPMAGASEESPVNDSAA